MRCTQYKDFYKQSFTMPIKGFRGARIEISMVLTALGILIFSAVFISFLFPGDKTVFGISKFWAVLGMTFVLTVVVNKIDTHNLPVFFYILSIISFFIKRIRRKVIVCFKEVSRPSKRKKYRWKIRYRDIVDEGGNILFHFFPLKGIVHNPRGISVEVTGATKLRYNPITKNIHFRTGVFEDLREQKKQVSKYKPLNMEVGRGRVQFLVHKGSTHAIYKPDLEERGVK